jgi:hypothetical protein
MRMLGVIINLGIVMYLGYLASSCLEAEQIYGPNTIQNPLILSFVAVIALFMALRY